MRCTVGSGWVANGAKPRAALFKKSKHGPGIRGCAKVLSHSRAALYDKNMTEKETRFVELGRYLCEVRAGQYWRVEKLKSFDEFLERRFPESRRKAYYLMSIHEYLPPEVKRELKQVGWTKGLELAKLARSRDGQSFDCATWLHKARAMPKEEFRQEVEKELTGKASEPHEIIYFKLTRARFR
jgi:hypothetical protein